jgi:hypothetical protein
VGAAPHRVTFCLLGAALVVVLAFGRVEKHERIANQRKQEEHVSSCFRTMACVVYQTVRATLMVVAVVVQVKCYVGVWELGCTAATALCYFGLYHSPLQRLLLLLLLLATAQSSAAELLGSLGFEHTSR